MTPISAKILALLVGAGLLGAANGADGADSAIKRVAPHPGVATVERVAPVVAA